MRFLKVLAALVVLGSVATTAHIINAFVQPVSGPDRVRAQVAFLNGAIAEGAPARMQELFPEGAFFTHVLTGLAAASVGDAATISATYAASGDPAIKATFGNIEALEHGTFYRGWRLLLAAELVRLTGTGTDGLLVEARAVQDALTTSKTGVPPSYPAGFWPCDAVVAMAAVIKARQVAGDPIDPNGVAAWRSKLDGAREAGTGLLAHQIDADGKIQDGPRGSSQSIIQAFWPTIDPAGAAGSWEKFRRTFVTSEAGLVGVREYPVGGSGEGDVDSGPLIFGVSASASAVTLAAARANGEARLAASLDHEAEYLGVPLEWSSQRRFAFGLLPVGDAFVAWARGVPLATTTGSPSPSPQPQWWWHAGLALLPGLAASLWLLSRIRRRTPASRRGRP